MTIPEAGFGPIGPGDPRPPDGEVGPSQPRAATAELLLDSADAAVVATDLGDRVTFWGRGAARLYDLAAAAAVGRKLGELRRIEWASPAAEEEARASLERIGSWRGRSVHVLPGGERRPVESTVTVLRDADGARLGLLALIEPTGEPEREAPARRTAYEELEALVAREAHYRLLFQDLLETSVVYRLLRDGAGGVVDAEVVDANRAGAEVLGLPAAALIGRRASSLLAAGEAADLVARLAAVAESGVAQRWEVGSAAHRYVLAGAYRVGDDLVAAVGVDITERRRAEEALRASEAEVKTILDTVPAGVSIARDPLAHRVDANRFGAELLRRSTGDNVSLTAPGLARDFEVRRDGRALAPEELPIQLAARLGVEIRDFDEEVVFPDGHTLHLVGNVSPLRDAAGRLTGSVGAFTDVTARRRAEEELRRSEERFRSVLEASRDCIYRLDVQSDRFVYISPAASRVLGVPPERLHAISGEDARRLLHPDDLPAFDAAVARLEETGDTTVEFRLVGGEGGERWLSNQMALTRDDRGRPRYRDGAMRDITERKLQERRLEKLSRLYAVLSSVNESVVRARTTEALFGEACRTLAEVGQRPLAWIARYQDDRLEVDAVAGPEAGFADELQARFGGRPPRGAVEQCLRSARAVVANDLVEVAMDEEVRAAVERHRLRAGAFLPLLLGGRPAGVLAVYAREPHAFDDEEVALWGALAADLSFAFEKMGQEQALREAHARLVESDRRKSEFLAMLSHELRNPLAPIRNSTYLLSRNPSLDERARHAAEVIERQVAQLTHLVDDLLDVTRIEKGKMRLEPAPLDLGELVRRTVEDHRSTLGGRLLALEVPPAPLPLLGDATRLSQLLGNLLHNAGKFTPRSGRIAVSLREAEGRARLEVSDTGVGIEPELLGRLFEPFAQAERALDRGQGGLGLGLALVLSIARLHGGEATAHSDGRGRGARFVVTLPIERLGGAAGVAPPPPPGPGRGARILVIEDNVDSAESLAAVLELAGHQVAIAFAGADGVAQARALRPQLVLCDIGLPGMDGYAVARALRDEPALAGARLVALSGYAQPEDREAAVRAGFDAHLAKPIDLERLDQLVAGLVVADGGLTAGA